MWLFDYREKKLAIAKEDAKLWFLLNNGSTLFAAIMSGKGKSPDFKYTSIEELLPVIKSQQEIKKEKQEWDDFSQHADKLANMWSVKQK